MVRFIPRKLSRCYKTMRVEGAQPRRLPAEDFTGRKRERCSRGGTYSDEVAGVSNPGISFALADVALSS